ncbi:hypothetical protein OC714_02360 [Candidatus Phytoplasma australasiaticum]|uniref:hypothetical protein n=1 Tax=Candidatus Phytoplasma australasiaticum TaxID=2754999 RepID=UPI0030E86325
MQFIFINGASSTGKTTLAREMIKEKKYSLYNSCIGCKHIETYQGEDAVILDFITPNTKLTMDALLKLILPGQLITNYMTKPFIYYRYHCKLLFIITTYDIQTIFTHLNRFNRYKPKITLEEFNDLMSYYIHLDEKYIYFQRWNFEAKKFEIKNKVKNYLYKQIKKYYQEKTEETKNFIEKTFKNLEEIK